MDTISRKVRAYLDAKAEHDAYAKQREKYPELRQRPGHAAQYTAARATWLVLMGRMTGGELGQAARIERAAQKETTNA
jgi:hypothetical protein